MASHLPVTLHRRILLLLSGLFLLAAPRANLRVVRWSPDGWRESARETALPADPVRAADLDQDGSLESLSLSGGRVSVDHNGQNIWTSPESWDVSDAQIADLNRDGNPEVDLLVWRPSAPWPVDAWQPYGGRISGFHDSYGRSCHIILWGWAGGQYRELWAGSALAEPILAFQAADWNGDGKSELAAVETDYADPSRGNGLSLWEWNGFGFSLVQRYVATLTGFAFLTAEDGQPLLLSASEGNENNREEK